MGNQSGETRPGEAAGAVGRRDFLRKAAVAGTGAFAVPMIVTVDRADARALTSPAPEPPGRAPPPVDRAGPAAPPSPPAGGARQGVTVTDRNELPRTGADLDRLVVAGLAATAGGVALVLWSADAKAKSAVTEPADPEPET